MPRILSRPCFAVALLSLVLLPTAGCTGDPDTAATPELIQSNEAGEAPEAEQAAAAEEAHQDEMDEAASQASQPQAPAERETFTADRLEQLVAPVALYPDALLMEILMAATYPAEVAEAAAWRKDHPDLMGKELDAAIAGKGWDVSVNSLVHATKALELMAADAEWTQDLGDAFLAQQDDVLNAVQVMRTKACDLGNLKTTAQQEVIIEDAPEPPAPRQEVPLVVQPPPRVVRILPVQPQVIYVPVYNPRVIYGPPPPVIFYPRVMLFPSIHVGVAPVISFGIGLSIGSFLWGDIDWYHRRVYSRPWRGGYRDYRHRDDYFRGATPWRHDVRHRRDIGYRSQYVATTYGGSYRGPGRPSHSYYPPGQYKDRDRGDRRGDDRRGGDRYGDRRDGDRARPEVRRPDDRGGDPRSRPPGGKLSKPPTDRSARPQGSPGGKPPKSLDRDDKRGGPGSKPPAYEKPSPKGPPGSSSRPPGPGMGKPAGPSGHGGRSGDRGPSRSGGYSKGGGSSSKGGSPSRGGSYSKGGGSPRGGHSPKGGSSSRGDGSSKSKGKDERGGGSSRGGGGGKPGR